MSYDPKPNSIMELILVDDYRSYIGCRDLLGYSSIIFDHEKDGAC
jgi:hypothetical protein